MVPMFYISLREFLYCLFIFVYMYTRATPEAEGEFGACKTGLSPPVILYF